MALLDHYCCCSHDMRSTFSSANMIFMRSELHKLNIGLVWLQIAILDVLKPLRKMNDASSVCMNDWSR